MTEYGKIVISAALSVLAHVSLFTTLALMPESVAVPVKPEAKPLEVTFEAAPQATAPAPTVEAETALAAPAPTNSIHTHLDPENLKKAEQAPEHPTEIAAHDSQATPPKAAVATPTPALAASTPPPDPSALTLEPVATPVPSPKPEDEVGIDALGNYGKAVGNAIGVRWEFYRKTQKDLPVGEVLIKFAIDAQGRVSEVQVVSNTAQSVNATFAVQAVKEAKIPPIPPERLGQVPGGRIEITYNFTSFPLQ